MAEDQVSTNPISSLPTQARVVIIGGGVTGCSLAYHLYISDSKSVKDLWMEHI